VPGERNVNDSGTDAVPGSGHLRPSFSVGADPRHVDPYQASGNASVLSFTRPRFMSDRFVPGSSARPALSC
jgi:hypothetical protein